MSPITRVGSSLEDEPRQRHRIASDIEQRPAAELDGVADILRIAIEVAEKAGNHAQIRRCVPREPVRACAAIADGSAP